MATTIENISGENIRVSLPLPIYNNTSRFSEDYSTGVMLRKVFYGEKTLRAVIETDSIWNDGTGKCRGIRRYEISISELLQLCNRFGIETPKTINVADFN